MNLFAIERRIKASIENSMEYVRHGDCQKLSEEYIEQTEGFELADAFTLLEKLLGSEKVAQLNVKPSDHWVAWNRMKGLVFDPNVYPSLETADKWARFMQEHFKENEVM